MFATVARTALSTLILSVFLLLSPGAPGGTQSAFTPQAIAAAPFFEMNRVFSGFVDAQTLQRPVRESNARSQMVIPEPLTLLLFGTGILALGGVMIRRRR